VFSCFLRWKITKLGKVRFDMKTLIALFLATIALSLCFSYTFNLPWWAIPDTIWKAFVVIVWLPFLAIENL
jgi:hypothetical protein